MSPAIAPCVTRRDVARLEHSVLDVRRRSGAGDVTVRELEERLESAVVVASEDIAADVVTMNSRVALESLDGTRRIVTLAYPGDAAAERACISVLAPLGRALLGARVGEFVRFDVSGFPSREYRVVDIVYQPESAGDLDL